LSSNIAVRLALAVGRRDHLLHAEVRANPLLEFRNSDFIESQVVANLGVISEPKKG
jgi:hypothetical protein